MKSLSLSARARHLPARLAARPAGILAGAVLVGVVLLVAWLQFLWLTQLSDEERVRRRVSLDVAAGNFSAYISRELDLLLGRANEASSLAELVDDEVLIETVIAIDAHGSARQRTPGVRTWQPVAHAEMQQRLGWPLARRLAAGDVGDGLWLNPPAIISCRTHCEAGVLSLDRLVVDVIEPTMRRTFASLGDGIAARLVIDGPESPRELLRTGARTRDFDVIDVRDSALVGVAIAGPPETRWLIEVNHAGASLEDAVARSHLRNVLLSVGLLSLLGVSIALVVANARRQSALASERLHFVAAVSHELRTPLTVISTAAENLADATVDDPQSTRRYGQLIHSEVGKLSSMIENVLQFAQAASAVRPRAQVPLKIAELLDEAIDDQAALLAGHDLHIDVPADLPIVRGDAAALKSVLANLLTNAARYSEGGNWIRVRASSVRVRPRGRALTLSVSNPVGKLRADPARFFEPFFRGANARQRGLPGTGIGLAVVRHVARQHGGGIRVRADRPGEITFALFLPIDDA